MVTIHGLMVYTLNFVGYCLTVIKYIMKKIICLILITVTVNAYSQKRESTSDYYGNGKIHYKGFEESWPDSVTPTLLYWRPAGTWNYWHPNGAKMLDLMHTRKGIRYISMWLPKGDQILQDGKGTYYSIDKNDEGGKDSLVYEIKDSIQHGKFSMYHIYKPNLHILCSTGAFDMGKKTGQWTFKDSVLQKNYQTYYFNDKENGAYKSFHNNGAVKEEGIKDNDEETGVWKYFDAYGKLSKEVTFKQGIEFGKYTEYFANGNVKETGQYSWTKGYTMVSTTDFDGNEKKVKKMSDRIPKKTGEWKFYDESGKLLSTKNLSAAPAK